MDPVIQDLPSGRFGLALAYSGLALAYSMLGLAYSMLGLAYSMLALAYSKIRTRGVFRVGLLAYKMVEFGKTLFCSSHPPLPLFIQSTRHLCQELWPTPDSPMSLVPGRPQAPMPRWNEPPDSPKSLVTNTLNKG